jgi:hypothetical protein
MPGRLSDVAGAAPPVAVAVPDGLAASDGLVVGLADSDRLADRPGDSPPARLVAILTASAASVRTSTSASGTSLALIATNSSRATSPFW